MQPLIIHLSGLPDGKSTFHWDLGKEFFALFGNSEFLEASLKVDARLDKSGDCVELDVNLGGAVTVPCDRCLAPLELEIGDRFNLSVKLGEGEDEEADKIDITQDVYDYACLSLPLHRVHEDGLCDQDVVSYLGSPEKDAKVDSPFASLGALLKDKK